MKTPGHGRHLQRGERMVRLNLTRVSIGDPEVRSDLAHPRPDLVSNAMV